MPYLSSEDAFVCELKRLAEERPVAKASPDISMTCNLLCETKACTAIEYCNEARSLRFFMLLTWDVTFADLRIQQCLRNTLLAVGLPRCLAKLQTAACPRHWGGKH
jgi:hypothetical protein